MGFNLNQTLYLKERASALFYKGRSFGSFLKESSYAYNNIKNGECQVKKDFLKLFFEIIKFIGLIGFVIALVVLAIK